MGDDKPGTDSFAWHRAQCSWRHKAVIGFANDIAGARHAHLAHPPHPPLGSPLPSTLTPSLTQHVFFAQCGALDTHWPPLAASLRAGRDRNWKMLGLGRCECPIRVGLSTRAAVLPTRRLASLDLQPKSIFATGLCHLQMPSCARQTRSINIKRTILHWQNNTCANIEGQVWSAPSEGLS